MVKKKPIDLLPMDLGDLFSRPGRRVRLRMGENGEPSRSTLGHRQRHRQSLPKRQRRGDNTAQGGAKRSPGSPVANDAKPCKGDRPYRDSRERVCSAANLPRNKEDRLVSRILAKFYHHRFCRPYRACSLGARKPRAALALSLGCIIAAPLGLCASPADPGLAWPRESLSENFLLIRRNEVFKDRQRLNLACASFAQLLGWSVSSARHSHCSPCSVTALRRDGEISVSRRG
jgi:hypothetical protein